MRYGYKASAEHFAPRPPLDFSVAAEEKGLESVVVSEHFQPWRRTHGHAPFSFASRFGDAAREETHVGRVRVV